MSTSTQAQNFIKTSINRSLVVKSTKVDSTIKAIINSFKNKNSTIVEYLNILRIVYYLKRLKFYNIIKFKSTFSKFSILFFFITIY